MKNDGFRNRVTTKKGDIGEEIVENILADKGYIIYKPSTEGRHSIDRFVTNFQDMGFGLEIKTKPRRLYHSDTGIDVRKYNQYKDIEFNMGIKIFLMFVDEFSKQIYGNYLNKLEVNSHKEKNSNGMMIYFQLSDMKLFHQLSEEELIDIKKYNNRNEKYQNEYNKAEGNG